MTEENYDAVISKAEGEIKGQWPRRVLLSADGDAGSPEKAYRIQGKFSDFIFIRDDGWSLGTIREYREVAERTWKEKWVAVIVAPSQVAIPYAKYLETFGDG